MQEFEVFYTSFPYVGLLVLFAFGACIGSFLNVCIVRLPEEDASVVKPSSFCPVCEKSIFWYDNIPLVSFLLLKGKCRGCETKISPRYFWVELFTALSFLFFFDTFGFTVRTLFLLYLFCSLIVATLVDFKHKIIPDEITLYGLLVGLIWSFIFPEVQFEVSHRLAIADSILGLLIGGGVIYLIAIFGDFVFKKESMGGGDIKLLALIGAFLGWKMALLAFLISPYFAIFIALYYKFYKKESTIPFGPFLSIGAVISIFYGPQLLAYFGV